MYWKFIPDVKHTMLNHATALFEIIWRENLLCVLKMWVFNKIAVSEPIFLSSYVMALQWIHTLIGWIRQVSYLKELVSTRIPLKQQQLNRTKNTSVLPKYGQTGVMLK